MSWDMYLYRIDNDGNRHEAGFWQKAYWLHYWFDAKLQEKKTLTRDDIEALLTEANDMFVQIMKYSGKAYTPKQYVRDFWKRQEGCYFPWSLPDIRTLFPRTFTAVFPTTERLTEDIVVKLAQTVSQLETALDDDTEHPAKEWIYFVG